jgi:hypothetical protein
MTPQAKHLLEHHTPLCQSRYDRFLREQSGVWSCCCEIVRETVEDVLGEVLASCEVVKEVDIERHIFGIVESIRRRMNKEP